MCSKNQQSDESISSSPSAKSSSVNNCKDTNNNDEILKNDESKDKKIKSLLSKLNEKVNCFETEIRWTHVLFMLTFHLISLHAIYLLFSFKIKLYTFLFAVLLHYLSNIGLTAGVHRLWSHKAYKARLPLRIFLMLCQTLSFQKSIITWSRDHRIHHKFSETTKDPHDIRRGVFFAHIGWILIKKRPEVFEAGNKISLDDLYSDSVVRFQASTYFPLMFLLCFIMPTIIPVYYWNESWLNAFEICVCLRYVIVLNISFLINSYSHLIGHRKYDLTLKSTDNFSISVLSAGEGTHNYHHAFPFDYSTSELNYVYNLTTYFIDAMAYIGQAYDLRKATADLIMSRRLRTGDLSSFNKGNNLKEK